MSSILLICALPEEKNALLEVFTADFQEIIISETFGLSVLKFNHNGHSVYIKESGMGNVNAGVGLALVLEKIQIDKIALIGVGGALTPELNLSLIHI